MLTLSPDELLEAMVQVAERDPSIARVLREIVTLDGAVRASALDLVGAHLTIHSAAGDVLDCVDALKRDEVARRLAERLGPPPPGA
ncbi:MAG: hypothetical protein HY616_04395 [Candidatus Rokubacteria bacterium]|nr:hypothetical protein [Candidatus Rokubacteria bacterium]